MSFVWNGVSSDTMKFNVTSRQVYNAPAYDLNAIEVPGRSGDLLNPQNRFKNKQVTYTGFLKASDFEGSTWREKLSTGLIQLKGWLCSDAGAYHELTDDYDPGFTRYGYISGETAISDIEDRPFGVTLTVTFNVKPYMYKAGEPMELPETKSASGSIITITDGAENTPLKSAVVNIEPVQDLHGYDYPWPAGGGKNKLVPALVNGSIAWNGVTLSVQNGELYLSGKATESGGRTSIRTASFTLPAGSYIISCVTTQFVLHDTSGNILANTLGTTTFTLAEATSVYAGFNVVDGTTYSGVLKAQIESGSTATSYTPYSNICPISGWSEVNVTRAGKNLFDPSILLVQPDKYSVNDDGSITVKAANNSAWDYLPEIILPPGTCTMSRDINVGNTTVRDITAGASIAYMGNGSDSNSSTFTVIEGHEIKIRAASGASAYPITINIQLELGSAATPYEPYVGDTYPIPLGRTAYGGTLDVVRGKLVVDRAIITPNVNGLQSINAYNIANFTFSFSGQKAAVDDYKLLAISNALKVQTSLIGTTQEQGFMISNRTLGYLRLDGLTVDTVAKANDWVVANNLRIVYYLETPVEVDLTPQIIKTLLGVNNIWADAGSMEIEYPIPTENPYLFGSRPLYEITMDGTGTLVVNGKEWTITDYTGTLYCDTEAMEWYDASQLRNNIVSGDGWPVFEAGENSVSYTGDITKVMVTPRWRTL